MPTPPNKPKAALDLAVMFPGRATLYVHEVAKVLSISVRHVVDLIDEGKLKAVNIAGDNTSDRKFYRIPVSEFENYLRRSGLNG